MIKIVLHCSDSGFGNAALIAKWHVRKPPHGRGWSGIGYHYVILNGYLTSKLFNKNFDGHLETGRPLDDDNMVKANEWGAHARGYNNHVGVCLIGRSGKFSINQVNALYDLIELLRKQFGKIEVVQHSDLDPVNKPHCAGLSLLFMDSLNTGHFPTVEE